MAKKLFLIVTAAGHGARMGAGKPKQFLELDGVPILRMTIEKFVNAIPGLNVMVVLPGDYMQSWRDYCLAMAFSQPQTIVKGGFTRYHSVKNALARIPDGAIVAIHDGVRPLLSVDMIKGMFSQFDENPSLRALIPVIPSTDTLRALDSRDGELRAMPGREVSRSEVYAVQTPQIFLSEDIRAAYAELPYTTAFTDDASVAEAKKIPLCFCPGERFNIKITVPEDLAFASAVLAMGR